LADIQPITFEIPSSHVRAVDAYARHKGISRSQALAVIVQQVKVNGLYLVPDARRVQL